MIATDESISSSAPLLRMQGIGKSFPGVRALDGIDLELHPGEVLALLGENGAGKSTLIKVLGGAHLPDEGQIQIQGQPTEIASPYDAQIAGIGIIYQEFNLVPALTARENIFLGHENSLLRKLNAGQERKRAHELFERIGVPVDPERLCRDLTVAQQQVVEIAKALLLEAKIIVMDEPSATLTPQEVDRLFAIIRELQSEGIGVIYISHRLEEIFEIADRVTVLRDGQHVDTKSIGELSRESMIEMMVGRTLEKEFPKQSASIGKDRLVVHNLCRGTEVNDISFNLRQGEVLGLTGLVGAGRTETVRLIVGADQPDSGHILLDGETCLIQSPRDAIHHGICLLTEDRKSQGLVLGLSCQDNFGLPNLGMFSQMGVLNHKAETAAFTSYVDSLRIKLTKHEQPVSTLSGGNQQKVVLAKWLQQNANVLIFDEPTRGIDVGAKYEIYMLMNRLVESGKAILMISSELPEILGMSDRILVMHQGRISGEICDVKNATQEDIMKLAIGHEVTS